ncbi:MAG TPA: hypothetical protein V6C72_16050, partial [Chroococcales cyanobacterium]
MKKWILCVVALSFFLPGAVMAQTTEQLKTVMNAMPEPAQQVIGRLGELNQLPESQWRAHAGDIPHGESPALDDSSWTIAKRGEEYANGAVWFRQWLEVPKNLHGYDLTGAKIWFSFQSRTTGRDSVTQIIYLDGRRVALGESLEKIELFDHAKPGDRILIAVKLLGTVGKKWFQGATESINFASDRPNPEDLHDEFLSAAFLVPSFSKDVTADQATLVKAIETVDLKALDAGDQEQFDASLRQSASALEALKPLLEQATLHLTGNSHIDAAWLWPRTETVDVV